MSNVRDGEDILRKYISLINHDKWSSATHITSVNITTFIMKGL